MIIVSAAKILLVALVLGTLLGSSSAGQQQADPMPFLHVTSRTTGQATRWFLADDQGRERLFRGVNLEAEVRDIDPIRLRSENATDYANGACPNNTDNYPEPPICEVDAGAGMYNQSFDDLSRNDFAQMRALGFNVIRLCLSWSSLEPAPGSYSSSFVDRVAQIVGWAKEQQIYVILDMHEDLYSRWIFGASAKHQFPPFLVAGDGQDGAPLWAVMTDGWPALNLMGIGNLNLAMMAAFDHFWNNTAPPGIPAGFSPGLGLQDHYIGAMAALARRFANESAVLGYEIMNEPLPGSYADQYAFAGKALYPFYKRVIQALTGVRDGLPDCPASAPTGENCAYPDLGIHVSKQAFFFEPSATRNLLDFSLQHSAVFSTYTNLVYAPHVYTHVFTFDQEILHLPWNNTFWPPSFDFAFETATTEAEAMHAAIFVTEFGAGPNSDYILLNNTLRAQERGRVSGGTLWAWKQGCSGSYTANSSWSMYDCIPAPGVPPQNGPLLPYRAQLMSRVLPRAVVGDLLWHLYDPEARAFSMQATIAPGEFVAGSETWVYIPRTVAGEVSSDPANITQITTNPDGSRLVTVTPAGPGIYSVSVGVAADVEALRLSAAASSAARSHTPAPLSLAETKALHAGYLAKAGLAEIGGALQTLFGSAVSALMKLSPARLYTEGLALIKETDRAVQELLDLVHGLVR